MDFLSNFKGVFEGRSPPYGLKEAGSAGKGQALSDLCLSDHPGGLTSVVAKKDEERAYVEPFTHRSIEASEAGYILHDQTETGELGKAIRARSIE
jgi:hypothetical protein